MEDKEYEYEKVKGLERFRGIIARLALGDAPQYVDLYGPVSLSDAETARAYLERMMREMIGRRDYAFGLLMVQEFPSLIAICPTSPNFIKSREGGSPMVKAYSALEDGTPLKETLLLMGWRMTEFLQWLAVYYFGVDEEYGPICDLDVKNEREAIDHRTGHIYCPSVDPYAEGSAAARVASTMGRGKRQTGFRDYISHENKEGVMEALRPLIEGTKGKMLAAYIEAAVELGILAKQPTFPEIKEAFGNVGGKSSFDGNKGRYCDGVYKNKALGLLRSHLAEFLTN